MLTEIEFFQLQELPSAGVSCTSGKSQQMRQQETHPCIFHKTGKH